MPGPSSVASGSVACSGVLVNTNTREGFVALDKGAVVEPLLEQLAADIASGAALRNPSLLHRFLAVTYADMKKYTFTYWFCFPALRPTRPAPEAPAIKLSAAFSAEEMASLQAAVGSTVPAAFLARRAGGHVRVAPLHEWDAFFSGVPPDDRILAFADPSTSPEHPGWPLRNVLALFHHHLAASHGS